MGEIVQLFGDSKATMQARFAAAVQPERGVVIRESLEALRRQDENPKAPSAIRELLRELKTSNHGSALDQARLCLINSSAGSAIEEQAVQFLARNAGTTLKLRDRAYYLQHAASNARDPELKQACQEKVIKTIKQALRSNPAVAFECIHACFQTIGASDADLIPIVEYALSEEFKAIALNPARMKTLGDSMDARDLGINLLDKAQLAGDLGLIEKAESFLGSCNMMSIMQAKYPRGPLDPPTN